MHRKLPQYLHLFIQGAVIHLAPGRDGSWLELGAAKRWLLFSSFYMWKNIMPLSSGETDAIQIQVTLCRAFSSF